jgi:hypothetical protein
MAMGVCRSCKKKKMVNGAGLCADCAKKKGK